METAAVCLAEILRTAWASIRANRLPMLVLWASIISLAAAYWRMPWLVDALEPIRLWQERGGIFAAFATQFVFCGILPALFLHSVREIRTEHPLVKCFLQSAWSGCWGIVYLWFYEVQGKMFGDGHNVATLVCKTAFDQFVWTPLLPVPLTSMFFLWMGSDFSFAKAAETCRYGYFRRVMLPSLVSNWAVWIPAVAAVYAFPRSLQIFMLGFVSCLWTLVCLQLGKRAKECSLESA